MWEPRLDLSATVGRKKKERREKGAIDSSGEGMLMRHFDVLELQTYNYNHSIFLSSLPWWLLALLNIGIPI